MHLGFLPRQSGQIPFFQFFKAFLVFGFSIIQFIQYTTVITLAKGTYPSAPILIQMRQGRLSRCSMDHRIWRKQKLGEGQEVVLI